MEPTAIDKAIDVLFHLHAQPGPVGVSELGRALQLPRSSAHRMLAALRRRELVEQTPDGRYRPGIGLLLLASGVSTRDTLVTLARPVLERAASELKETFFLVAARDGRLRVLDKAEGTGVLRASPTVGSALPVHATAVGKLYLAHAPAEVHKSVERERFTAHTLLDEQALRVEVQRALERGYAHNHQEWIEGLSVLAAPLRPAGRMLGAICIALPTARVSQLNQDVVAKRLLVAAASIEARMQGSAT